MCICVVFLIKIIQASLNFQVFGSCLDLEKTSLGLHPGLQANPMHREDGSVYIETRHIIPQNNHNPETFILQENSQRHRPKTGKHCSSQLQAQNSPTHGSVAAFISWRLESLGSSSRSQIKHINSSCRNYYEFFVLLTWRIMSMDDKFPKGPC